MLEQAVVGRAKVEEISSSVVMGIERLEKTEVELGEVSGPLEAEEALLLKRTLLAAVMMGLRESLDFVVSRVSITK